MEPIEAKAIELLERDGQMIVQKNYSEPGFLLYRPNAVERDTLKARIGHDGLLTFWMGDIEFTYNGKYIVHWV